MPGVWGEVARALGSRLWAVPRAKARVHCMAGKSLADCVAALDAKVGGKTIEEQFREQAELIDKLFIYRFDEMDKRWDARLDAKLRKLENALETRLDARSSKQNSMRSSRPILSQFETIWAPSRMRCATYPRTVDVAVHAPAEAVKLATYDTDENPPRSRPRFCSCWHAQLAPLVSPVVSTSVRKRKKSMPSWPKAEC